MRYSASEKYEILLLVPLFLRFYFSTLFLFVCLRRCNFGYTAYYVRFVAPLRKTEILRIWFISSANRPNNDDNELD